MGMIPQILIIVMGMIELGIHIGKHGEKRISKYNWRVTLIATGIVWYILHHGGFWEPLFD
jgi:hypothetical protein